MTTITTTTTTSSSLFVTLTMRFPQTVFEGGSIGGESKRGSSTSAKQQSTGGNFVRLKFGTQKATTTVSNSGGSRNPQWNETFHFSYHNYNLSADTSNNGNSPQMLSSSLGTEEKLLVEVWRQEEGILGRMTNPLLGSCEVELSAVHQATPHLSIRRWFVLSKVRNKGKKEDKKPSGEIHLRVSLVTSKDEPLDLFRERRNKVLRSPVVDPTQATAPNRREELLSSLNSLRVHNGSRDGNSDNSDNSSRASQKSSNSKLPSGLTSFFDLMGMITKLIVNKT